MRQPKKFSLALTALALSLLVTACDDNVYVTEGPGAPYMIPADRGPSFQTAEESYAERASGANAAAPMMLAKSSMSIAADHAPVEGEEGQTRHIAETQHWRYVVPAERIEPLWSAHSALCIAGCEITQANVSARSDYAAHATLEMRIERGRFDAMRSALEATQTPFERAVSREDKTLQVVDLESRMSNLKTMAERLRSLVDTHGGKLPDLLALERELNRVQSEIDSMQSRRRVLAQETEKVRLSIQYQAEPRTNIEDAWSPVREAWHDMARRFNASLADLMRFVAGVAPWLLIGLPAAVASWKFIRLPGRLIGRLREKWKARKARPEV